MPALAEAYIMRRQQANKQAVSQTHTHTHTHTRHTHIDTHFHTSVPCSPYHADFWALGAPAIRLPCCVRVRAGDTGHACACGSIHNAKTASEQASRVPNTHTHTHTHPTHTHRHTLPHLCTLFPIPCRFLGSRRTCYPPAVLCACTCRRHRTCLRLRKHT